MLLLLDFDRDDPLLPLLALRLRLLLALFSADFRVDDAALRGRDWERLLPEPLLERLDPDLLRLVPLLELLLERRLVLLLVATIGLLSGSSK